MTKAQLQSIDITYDQWINLSGVCMQLLLSNESRIYTTRGSYQFYFEDDSGLLFVRFIDRIVDREPTYIDDSHVIDYIDTDGMQKYGILVPGGIDDSSVGVYHLVIDINEIVATL